MRDLEGKVAFITGGASGIGLGIAHALVNAGMRIVIASRRRTRLDQALASLKDKQDLALALELDVTDRAAMLRAAEEVERVFGKIHLLCNNAGVGIAVPIAEATYNDWDWALSVNLGGVINGLQVFLPRILAHGEGGHIVTTSSMSGLFLNGRAGVYSTTKYAVVAMMESLRDELEETDVGVSVYCPGIVNTSIHESEEGRPARYYENRAPSAARKAQIKNEIMATGMDPDEAGLHVMRGIRENRLYILSHPEYEQGVRERFAAMLASMPRDVAAPGSRVRVAQRLSLLSHPVYRKELERLGVSVQRS